MKRITEDQGAVGAIAMRAAAEKAVDAAKATLLREIEQALPEDANPRNASRQVGAMITACSMIYADMLGTFVKHGGKGEAVLIAGLLQNMIAEHLVAIGHKLDRQFPIEVFSD